MQVGMLVLMLTTAFLATQSAATTSSPCGLAMASAVGTVSAELCLAEQETKLGDAAKQGQEQTRHRRLAQSHYRRSADLATDVAAKKRALKAVRNWRYESTIVNGQAVPVRMSVTVNFTKPRER